MKVIAARLFRRARSAGLIAAALSLIVSQTAAGADQCPDAPTVSAAQLIEFKTMMMVVGLRCKSVGVMMADHNDEFAAARRTMFEEADDRVRRYLAAKDRPAPVQTVTAAAAKAPFPKGKGPLKAAASAAKPAVTLALKPLPKAVMAKAPKTGPKLAPKPAPRSRREDPYEQYLTRVGQLYGMGSNSVDKCRQFDTVAVHLADRTSPNRLMTMVAQEMVGAPVLERMAGCSSGR